MAQSQQPRFAPADYYDAPRSAPLESPREYQQDIGYGSLDPQQGYAYDDGYNNGYRNDTRLPNTQQPQRQPQQRYPPQQGNGGRGQMRDQRAGYSERGPSRDPRFGQAQNGYGQDTSQMQGGAQRPVQNGHQQGEYHNYGNGGQQNFDGEYQQAQGPPRPRFPPQRSYSAGAPNDMLPDHTQQNMLNNQPRVPSGGRGRPPPPIGAAPLKRGLYIYSFGHTLVADSSQKKKESWLLLIHLII
jgi:hypothetical protein